MLYEHKYDSFLILPIEKGLFHYIPIKKKHSQRQMCMASLKKEVGLGKEWVEK